MPHHEKINRMGARMMSKYIPIVLLESVTIGNSIPGQSLHLAPTKSIEHAIALAKSGANSIPNAVGFTIRVLKDD